MLDSRYAMWMLWGAERTFFCNDAYLPTVGIKRDWVMGARADQVWEEIWPEIGPRIQHVLRHGEATWDEGLLLFLERSGFGGDIPHVFLQSGLRRPGAIAGMLCVVTEVTERVLGERQLHTLRDLAALSSGTTVQEAADQLVSVLSATAQDVPFVELYLLNLGEQRAWLAAHHGSIPEAFRPNQVLLTESESPWPLAAAVATGLTQIVELPAGGIELQQFRLAGPGRARDHSAREEPGIVGHGRSDRGGDLAAATAKRELSGLLRTRAQSIRRHAGERAGV